MARYIYTAKPAPDKTIQGNIEADSEQDAINKLTKLGYFPISVSTEDLSSSNPKFLQFRKISQREVVLFTRQLASLIESGVNILSGLDIISNQISNKNFKAILRDITGKIKDGSPLSKTLSEYPNLFPNFYTSMILSGETGGTLEQTLKRLADFMEKEEEFKNSIRAALTYPLFVFSVGVLTIIVLLVFVIPRLVTMFEDMGQALPLPTKILIDTSAAIRNYWWLILALIAALIFSLRRSMRKEQGKLYLDNLKLKVPILGAIILKTEVSRLMRTLSILLSSGVSIVPSLDLSSSVIDNSVLKSQMQKFKEDIAGGVSFSHCLKESKIFPDFVTNIVAVGEETGTMEKSLLRIADDYEKDADQALKNLSRLLEPVIILAMGLVVGFIVLSMLLPIFQINLIVR